MMVYLDGVWMSYYLLRDVNLEALDMIVVHALMGFSLVI